MSTPAQALAVALDTMRANPLRTLLSTLGVVIGVAALVAILALSDGLEQYSREQLLRTTDLQIILVTPATSEVENGVRVARERVVDIGVEDVADLREELGTRARATLVLTGSGRALFPGDTTGRVVLIRGVLPEAEALLPDGLQAGRFFDVEHVQRDARVAVLQPPTSGAPEGAAGEGASAELRAAEWEALLGADVEVDGVVYRIIGVTPPGRERAPSLVVPLGNAVRSELERPDRRAQLVVRAERVEDVLAVRQGVERWLASRYGDLAAFQVVSHQARAEQSRQAMLVFKLIMGSIAGISLLVGGIGIMNILLASVFERTREIGVRRAAGARRRDILLQFLAESVAISGLGSVLGVVLGLGGAFIITAGIRQLVQAPVYAAFTWSSILVAATAAVVVGLVFGTYPARRAAELSPMEAIRHE